jgi:dTDP-4-dehydrorhamnose reductase
VLDRHLFDYTQLDITNKSDVKSLVTSFRPDIIVNAAAMTNVDACETQRELAWKVNVIGVENLVEVARRINCLLIHISTDYVFDGKNGPYKETDRVNPVNYYGKTKLAGENVILAGGISSAILRAIVVYGTGINVKSNFALWVINSLREGKNIRCVDDQISNPTHVSDLAASVVKLIERERTGLFHICGADAVSRYEFAVRAAEIFGFEVSLIQRIKSVELHQPAVRPMVTGFVTEKAQTELDFHPMTSAQGLEALKRELLHLTLN